MYRNYNVSNLQPDKCPSGVWVLPPNGEVSDLPDMPLNVVDNRLTLIASICQVKSILASVHASCLLSAAPNLQALELGIAHIMNEQAVLRPRQGYEACVLCLSEPFREGPHVMSMSSFAFLKNRSVTPKLGGASCSYQASGSCS